MDKIVISLEKHRSPKTRTFSGREKGKALRKKYDLIRLDQVLTACEVIIPLDITSINESFFLGLFGKSVRTLGKSKFKELVSFLPAEKFDSVLGEDYEDCLDLALKESSSLDQE